MHDQNERIPNHPEDWGGHKKPIVKKEVPISPLWTPVQLASLLLALQTHGEVNESILSDAEPTNDEQVEK